MGHQNPKGQSSVELIVILVLLTSFVLAASQMAVLSLRILKPVLLSKEQR